MRHPGPLALFAALAIAWTWPLARHLNDAIPGGPGDNYSFVWNLWWMRHVLATPGLAYFHTTYLFAPFGTTIADHPQTALPALFAATVLKPLSVVAAQNVLLIGYVFANLAVMYALAWDITRQRRASVLAALIFGLSPYLAVHLLGHFDLIAAFVLPLFALAVRRAVVSGSIRWAACAGVVFAATAYTAYYYVVYQAFFLAVYLIAWVGWTPVRFAKRAQTPATRRIRVAIAALASVLAAFAVWVIVSGGRVLTLGAGAVSIRTPQNALTGVWICVIVYLLCIWRPAATHVPVPVESARRAFAISAWIIGVFLAGAAPLLWQAAQLIAHGEYVTQRYSWRSIPLGVDLLAPFLGHPRHPLMAAFSGPAYAAFGLNTVEAIGWIGIVPIVVLLIGRAGARAAEDDETRRELRAWRIVAIAFAIFALGPVLMLGGFDTGLKLPEILLRYVPFAANARMPGRAIIVVSMAAAVLIALTLRSAGGRLRAPALQWLLAGLIAFEYWAAPIPLTALDRPPVYAALAAAPPGAVCEVPFGIGDGLSVGVGSQDRRVLYYATLHEHPLAGGYIGRMPADAAERYAALAVAGPLLRLSDGAGSAFVPRGESPCRYLVVNRATSSAALSAFIASLPTERLASDDSRDLYRLR